MKTSHTARWSTLAGACALFAVPLQSQASCDDFPELSSCNTTPVGVCDAAAAANYVLEEGHNQWLVVPVDDDPMHPGACSYEDDMDPINPQKITSKDDTNNLQCALDFAAAKRTSADMKATITLKKGRYCVRSTLVGLDFSGTIQGAGKRKTVVDFANPAVVDAQGHLTGEGGFRLYYDAEKSVMDQNGDPIDLQDRVIFMGDVPAAVKARRYFSSKPGGLVLANNRFNQRQLIVQDLHFNVSKNTRAYTDTIHGYGNVAERPGSFGAIIVDHTELGGETVSLGGLSDNYYAGCLHRAGAVRDYSGPSWYEADTGVDLTTVDPELCIVPTSGTAALEHPVAPRSCTTQDPEDCTPYRFEINKFPSLDTKLARLKVTARGNVNNGLYYLNSDSNRSVDLPVGGEHVVDTFNQPIHLNFVLKDSTLRGLSSPIVGSLFDFGGTPIVDGKLDIKNNYMGVLREEETYGCGRIWERLNLSGTVFDFRSNTVDGCQGAIVQQSIQTAFHARGVDSGYNGLGASMIPIPLKSIVRLQNNDYTQGPVRRGVESPVASFFTAVDHLNNTYAEMAWGITLPTLDVRIQNNRIHIANYSEGDIYAPDIMVPISLIGLTSPRVRDNTISGVSAAAIAIGQYFESGGWYDVGAKIINNDLSGFAVVPCDIHTDFTHACSTNTAAKAKAAKAKVWLGPYTSLVRLILANTGRNLVGDLSPGNSGNKISH